MSFREKSDWLSFASLCLLGIYFFEIGRGVVLGGQGGGPYYYFTLFWVQVGALVGAFLTIGTMHMDFSVWQFAHCILFVIWIAELLRYGMRLYYYRRAV